MLAIGDASVGYALPMEPKKVIVLRYDDTSGGGGELKVRYHAPRTWDVPINMVLPSLRTKLGMPDLTLKVERIRPARLDFCTLRDTFRPFYKGLKYFSSLCIQSGIAKNPFLPSGVT